MTEKTRKATLVAFQREHATKRSLRRCGRFFRRGAPSEHDAQRSTCRLQGCAFCGNRRAQHRANEVRDRVPDGSTVVMLTLTSRDRRGATLQERWVEEDLLWQAAFTNSKWLQRHAGRGAGWRRFPDLTFHLDPFAPHAGYRPHPHHHVVVVLSATNASAAEEFARAMIWQYVRTARRLGVEVSLPGQNYFVAAAPDRAIRYAAKPIGFSVGTEEDDGMTMAEVGIIAATTGDADAADAYLDALAHPGRLAPAGGVLAASSSASSSTASR